MTRTVLLTLALLPTLVAGSPELQRLQLRPGEQAVLAVPADSTIRITDDTVLGTERSGDELKLIARGPGQAVLTVRGADGPQTYVIAIAEPADAVTPTQVAETVPAGLSVAVEFDRAQAVAGEIIHCNLTARNNSGAAARRVTVESDVPAGLVLEPATLRPAGHWDPQARQVRWELPSLDPDQETLLSYRATIGQDVTAPKLMARASVRSSETAPGPGATAEVEVVRSPLVAAFAVPDVLIAKTGSHEPMIDVDRLPGQRLVERLENLGVISGYPDGSFRPNDSVSRAEATKMVVAVRQLAGLRDRASISVALARPATVAVTLTDDQDRLVRHLADSWALPAGHHQLVWDGTRDSGEPAPMGVYRWQVIATDELGVKQTLDGTIQVVTVRPLPTNLETTFEDVPKEAWFHRYVAKAEHDGIVRGYPGGQFRPNEPIRRVENTVMVIRAAGLDAEAQARMNSELGFADADSIPRWAVGYVAVATDREERGERPLLIGYTDNRFLPNQSLRRSEAALILERLLDHEDAVEVTASGTVAPGHTVEINGQPVTAGQNGRFRQPLSVRADQGLVPVRAR